MSLALRRGRRALKLISSISVVTLTVGACSPAPEPLSESDAAIVGGSLDTTHKAVVSLLRQVEQGFAPSCSGTLLTQNLVLTARHCVAGLDSPDGATVECGQTEFRGTRSPSSMLVSVEAKVGQEGLNPYRVADVWVANGSASVCGGDIALLLLSGRGIPGSVAQPIQPGFRAEVEPQAVFAAIGYGLQDPNDQQGETAGERMGVDDARVFCAGLSCGTELVTTGEWIADSPVCSGDSGGPALDQAGQVVGVTSRGDPDCTVGIYTSVFAWRDFITDGVFAAAKSGGYAPPVWAGEPPPGYLPPGTGGSGGSAGSNGGGTADAGGPTIGGSAAGPNGAMSPVIDPLGLACTGSCPGNYKCWAESGMTAGICVPACSDAATSCPADYACWSNLGACVPERAIGSGGGGDGEGCSVAAASGVAGGASWLWLGAVALVVVARKRRR